VTSTEAVVALPMRRASTTSRKVLHREGLDAYVVRRLGPALPRRRLDDWDDLLRARAHPKHEVTIALVGKYIDLPDAYLSVDRGAACGWFRQNTKVHGSAGCLRRLRDPEEGAKEGLGDVDAVWCPAASALRGIEGKLGAITHARRTSDPHAGHCAWVCSAW
jgi:CTP synthase